jgi:hypothetical protein
MHSQVIPTFHRPDELRCDEAKQAAQMFGTIAVPFIHWN